MTQSLEELLVAGAAHLKANRRDEAQALSASLLERFPDDIRARLFAVDLASARGDRKAAIGQLDTLLQAEPANPGVLLRKAQLLFADYRRGEARAVAQAAAGHVQSDVRHFRAFARILADCQDLEGARALLERAHARFPREIAVLFDLAVAEFQLNRVEEAEQHLAELLQLAPFHPGALRLRSMLRSQTSERNHIEDLEGRLARMPQRPDVVAGCCYALAKEYEDLQQYEKSFRALERGARACRSTLKYDTQVEMSSLRFVREVFPPDAFRSLGPGFETEGPIFIVGMPRTGTTLLERLLASHSQVWSVGEFTVFPPLLAELVNERLANAAEAEPAREASLRIDFRELGMRYTAAARQLSGERPYFVDKLPFNFLYCGYILAALPGAKLIHLMRDPMDTCYAVYKTQFVNAYHWSYDLDELADYYVGYREQMDHWHRVLPGRILDVQYEDLVRDTEGQARRVLEWCGLTWEDSVLAYHDQDRPSMTASAAQVRRPVYADSIGSWRRAAPGMRRAHDRLVRARLITQQEEYAEAK
jgi:tetratricopeptide (TPR) repeat protein